MTQRDRFAVVLLVLVAWLFVVAEFGAAVNPPVRFVAGFAVGVACYLFANPRRRS